MMKFFELLQKLKVFKQNSKKENNDQKTNNKLRDKNIKIISDEPADIGLLDFSRISEMFSNIIINSPSKFSIGIFGDWGTGKTTLMKMIKRELENMQIISWKDINQDSEKIN